jgi:hypothetical protein
MQRLLRHVIFLSVRPGSQTTKARLGSTGRAFHRERQTSGREALFQIDGFSLDRAVNGAPDLIGQPLQGLALLIDALVLIVMLAGHRRDRAMLVGLDGVVEAERDDRARHG